MFDLGSGEMILLAAIALIAIGPKQLPEVARSLGKMLNELKRSGGELTTTFLEARDSTNKLFSDAQKSLLDSVAKTGEIIESAKIEIKPVQVLPDPAEGSPGSLSGNSPENLSPNSSPNLTEAPDPNQLTLAPILNQASAVGQKVAEEHQLSFDFDKASKDPPS